MSEESGRRAGGPGRTGSARRRGLQGDLGYVTGVEGHGNLVSWETQRQRPAGAGPSITRTRCRGPGSDFSPERAAEVGGRVGQEGLGSIPRDPEGGSKHLPCDRQPFSEPLSPPGESAGLVPSGDSPLGAEARSYWQWSQFPRRLTVPPGGQRAQETALAFSTKVTFWATSYTVFPGRACYSWTGCPERLATQHPLKHRFLNQSQSGQVQGQGLQSNLLLLDF